MPRVGLEPTRPLGHKILNLARAANFATKALEIRLQRLQRSFGITHWSVTYKTLGDLGRFRVSDPLRYYKPFFAGYWSPVLESDQLLQFCRLTPRRRAYWAY